MIHEEDPGVEEDSLAADDEGGFEDVYGEAPPVDDHHLSTRPVASGGS